MALVLLMVLISMAAPTMACNRKWQGNSSECGKNPYTMNTMIVGGTEARQFEWPWQVAMYKSGNFRCGGSIIDPWWVITAAHCIFDEECKNPETFTFRAGAVNLYVSNSYTQRLRASKIFVHPKYDDDTLDNDIALVKLQDPFVIYKDKQVNTVCLPKSGAKFDDVKNAFITGWGYIDDDETVQPDRLHQGTVPIIDTKTCNATFKGGITANMICAGDNNGGTDACVGDSGGPLVAYPDKSTSNQYYLAGIVSFGADCGRRSYTGVYTRVTRYEDWIRPIFNSKTPTSAKCGCDGKLSATAKVVISLGSVMVAMYVA